MINNDNVSEANMILNNYVHVENMISKNKVSEVDMVLNINDGKANMILKKYDNLKIYEIK